MALAKAMLFEPGIGPHLLRRVKSPLAKYGRDLLQLLAVLAALYLFISAINLMGSGLKSIAKDPDGGSFMKWLFGFATCHPLAGLSVGILATSIVQSSSFTTVMVLGFVASGQIGFVAAVPIIMGANIGTSVTNLLVSLANLRNRVDFRRALGGAIVHDFFNVLSVIVILPLEMAFGLLSKPAGHVGKWLEVSAFHSEDPRSFNFVKMAVKPLSDFINWFFVELCNLGKIWGGAVIAAIALVLLFLTLFFMVKLLQGLLKDRMSGLFSRTLFRNPPIAFVVGILVTAAVQSSSVTTSLVVPLVGAGILSIRQIYPYTMGANIGTTITAIMGAIAMAALAAGQSEAKQALAASALAVASAHLMFNIYGTAIFWPLQWIPISLAKGFAKMASRRRLLAAVYIIVVFFIVPIALIAILGKYYNKF